MLVPSPVGQPPSADWLLETVVVTGAGGREPFLEAEGGQSEKLTTNRLWVKCHDAFLSLKRG